jgi:hypothetical protein
MPAHRSVALVLAGLLGFLAPGCGEGEDEGPPAASDAGSEPEYATLCQPLATPGDAAPDAGACPVLAPMAK